MVSQARWETCAYRCATLRTVNLEVLLDAGKQTEIGGGEKRGQKVVIALCEDAVAAADGRVS